MHEGMSGGMCGSCKCPHHKIVPLAIIVIGLVFLLAELGMMAAHTAGIIWPIALIVIGVMKMMKGMCSCCSHHGMMDKKM